MTRLTPGVIVKEIENKKFSADIRITDLGPCSFCGWNEDGPVSTCVVVGDPKLRHRHSLKAANCTTTKASVCPACQPYVRWRNKRISRDERYRCPTCFPLSDGERAGIKLERESGGNALVREAQEMVRAVVQKYIGRPNDERLRAEVESDITTVMRSLGHTRPITFDLGTDPLVGNVELEL